MRAIDQLAYRVTTKREEAERELARQIWAVLSNLGMTDLLQRFPAKPVAITPPSGSKRTKARNRRPKKFWRWTNSLEMLDWRRALLARVLSLPPGHEARREEIKRIVRTIQQLPDGTRVWVSSSRLGEWLREAARDRGAFEAAPTDTGDGHDVAGAPPPSPPSLGIVRSTPGNPVELSASIPTEEIAEHRRTNCPSYAKCLDVAVRKAWTGGFSCGACSGPGRRAHVRSKHQ